MFYENDSSFKLKRLVTSRALVTSLLALSCVLAHAQASAQNFPSRPMKLIVTSSPGGPTDVLARPIAEKMGEILGQTVVVDNVPGGNTMIAAGRTIRGEADGYTMFLASSSTLSLNPATRKKLPYDADKDFVPVVLVGANQYVLAARSSLGITKVSELIDLAKKKPGDIKYGMSVGSPAHFAALMLEASAGIKMMGVPYKDVASATKDLLVGEVDIVFAPLSTVENLIDQKLGVNILGVAHKKRMARLPNTPTIEEQGFKDVWGEAWYGVVLKSGSPAEAVQKLNHAINTALKNEGVRERLTRAGLTIYGGTPQELDEYIKREAPVYKRIAQNANISID